MRDITDEYTNEMYYDYYKKSINWDAYYEHLAEMEDEYYE